jgi:predicted TPR repeat methyltransferase
MPAWFDKLSARRASGPDAAAVQSMKQGNEHVGREAWSAAADCYRQAVSIDADYIDARIGLGFALLEQKQYGEAETHLRHALSLRKDIADAHYLLGRLHQERDDSGWDQAIDHFTKAVTIKPDFEVACRALYLALVRKGDTQSAKDLLRQATAALPRSSEFQVYLANLLSGEGAHAEAIKWYEAALRTQPDSAELHHALGEAQRNLGDLVAAAVSLRRASALNPKLVGSHIKLGMVLESHGDFDAAISSFLQAVALKPELATAHHYLGNAYLRKGATQEAIGCFREVARLEPSSGVTHLIEALSGTTSERAPDEYVAKLFDQYAERFDSHLVATLKYSVPEQLAELLKLHSQREGEKWDVLDLGCGTGLGGVAIAPYARQLVGVDLSAKMLEKAATRGLYARLEHLDLVAMMKLEPPDSYDVVIAADVLVYIGRLDHLVAQVRRILRTRGLFAFSVESLDVAEGHAPGADADRDFRLAPTGRYVHSAAYLRALAFDQGFEVLQLTETEGRVDKGKAVHHYLCLWQGPSAARPPAAPKGKL